MSKSIVTSQEYNQPSPQLAAELARVKNRFIEAFASKPDLVETDMIDAYFTDNGLHLSPTVIVPHDKDNYAAARTIALDTTYPLPWLHEKFTEERAQADPSVGGFSFALPIYGLNFVSDDSEILVAMYGKEIARQTLTVAYAHELAHGAFYEQPKIKVEYGPSGSVSTISEHCPLSGMNHQIFGPEAASKVVPVWAEEAFAVYVSGQATKPMLTEGEGLTASFEAFGKGEFHVSEHYVARSPDFPDEPGLIAGAVAGETLELLDAKIPGTIDKMFQVARGEFDSQRFRSELRKQLTPELYDLMFESQPYTTWTDTYRAVQDL